MENGLKLNNHWSQACGMYGGTGHKDTKQILRKILSVEIITIMATVHIESTITKISRIK